MSVSVRLFPLTSLTRLVSLPSHFCMCTSFPLSIVTVDCKEQRCNHSYCTKSHHPNICGCICTLSCLLCSSLSILSYFVPRLHLILKSIMALFTLDNQLINWFYRLNYLTQCQIVKISTTATEKGIFGQPLSKLLQYVG